MPNGFARKAGQDLPGADILIVDDVPQNLELLSHILNCSGYSVRTALDGDTALKLAKGKVPDLILLDVCMPGMPGFEVCRQLKCRPETRNVPVIFVTALQDAEDKVEGFNAGAIDYITKPFDQAEVLARVRIHLELNAMRHHLERMVADRTAEVRKSNRALQLISQCNKILVRTMDESTLLNAICKVLIEVGGFPFCWVGYPRSKENNALDTAAFAGVDHGSEHPLAAAFAQGANGDSGMLEALESGVPVVCENMPEQNDSGCQWRRAAVQNELLACISLPLIYDRQPYGVLSVFAYTPHIFKHDEIELLKELCNDLAFGIQAIRNRREHQRAQKALAESEQRYRQLFEKAGDAILMLHSEESEIGRIVQANQAAARMLDRPVDDLIGKPISVFWSPREQENIPGRMDRIMTNGWIHEEIEHVKKDGTVFPVESSAGLIDIGSYRYILAFGRDISDRKRVEAENAAFEVQIRRANKMEAIGTLASGIAHDFNNILSAASGYTELSIPLVPPDSILSSNLHRIQEANKRAAELVRHILTLSRERESTVQVLQPKIIIKEALKLLRASLPTTIDIKQQVEADGYVMGDAAQVHQIVMNLCVNAGHAMEDTGGVLSVSLTDEYLEESFTRHYVELLPGAHVVLTISDTGSGIPANILDKIFDPYFTTKSQSKGTGLGLSVVLGIVNNYGGTIAVESHVGEGTRFTIYLPAVVAREGEKVESDHPIPRGEERVLLVDDEPELVEIGHQILQLLGYKVTPCTESAEALALYQKDPQAFDLLITDYTMPKITGTQLAGRLLEINPQLPVILMSGLETSNLRAEANHLGIRGFLNKPIMVEEIAVLIRKLLDEP